MLAILDVTKFMHTPAAIVLKHADSFIIHPIVKHGAIQGTLTVTHLSSSDRVIVPA